MGWLVGQGMHRLTPVGLGTLMLGYAFKDNVAEAVRSDLHARCFILRSENSKDDLVYCNLELCFITEALKNRILELIHQDSHCPKWTAAQVVIAAQHTHAGPSGYDHYPYYNVPSGGLIKETLETIAQRTYLAIKEALNDLSEAKLYFDETEIGEEVDIAFNRSLAAYMKNPEMKGSKSDFRGATHRVMSQLEVHKNDKMVGLINWFAVHATSVSRDNKYLCADNKGYASIIMEENLRSQGVGNPVAIFAQACSGDVSPNFRPRKDNPELYTGPTDDQYKNAEYNGRLHVDFSKKIFSSLKKINLHDHLDYELVYENMGQAPIDDHYLPAKLKGKQFTTSSGCVGVAFARGGWDGAGLGEVESKIVIGLTQLVRLKELRWKEKKRKKVDKKVELKYLNQDPKNVFCETGEKQVMGIKDLKWLLVPNKIDPMIGIFKKMHADGALDENTWVQEVLPFHLLKIGQLALASLPFEPTTMCGVRLRALLEGRLKAQGCEKILALGYTNSYAGYVVTPEEYMAKKYESGHTLFGRYTLPAILTIFNKMAQEMSKKKEHRNFEWSKVPPKFSQETLAKRTYLRKGEHDQQQLGLFS